MRFVDNKGLEYYIEFDKWISRIFIDSDKRWATRSIINGTIDFGDDVWLPEEIKTECERLVNLSLFL